MERGRIFMANGRLRLLLVLVVGLLVTKVQGAYESNYVLGPMDLITIQVFGEADLSNTQRIDGSGDIRMGLIGSIAVGGKTLKQAEDFLEAVYVERRFLRNPQVSIQVEEYAPQYVSILGQVKSPGRVQLEDELHSIRIVDAISAVGGFTGIAKSDSVRITRLSADGEEVSVVVDADGLINGKKTNTPPEFLTLLPGDVVFVPERLF